MLVLLVLGLPFVGVLVLRIGERHSRATQNRQVLAHSHRTNSGAQPVKNQPPPQGEWASALGGAGHRGQPQPGVTRLPPLSTQYKPDHKR